MEAAPIEDGKVVHLHRVYYEAQQRILACAVLDPGKLASVDLEPKDFTDGPHVRLWECLRALFAEGEPIDVITVAERCEEIGHPEDSRYLMELVANTAGDAGFDSAVTLVWRESRTAEFWRQIRRALATRSEDEIVRAAEEIMARRAPGLKRAVQADIGTAYQALTDEIAEFKRLPKSTWGITKLDRHVGPMQGTRLYVVMARPATGKTAFALNVALANAKAGKRVGFISLEQSMEQIAERSLCILSGCTRPEVRGDYTPVNPSKLDAARTQLACMTITVNDSTPANIGQIQAAARSLVHRQHCDMIVVDYLQKIHGPKQESRHMEVAHVAMGLKDMARKLGVPVLALAQANRDAEGKRPTMADVRDSGFIEQEADVIIAIHRERDSSSLARSGECELIVLKNRDGESDLIINAAFVGSCYRFADLEDRY